MRRVISLWLPRFATDRQRRRTAGGPSRPEPATRPLALVSRDGARLVLAAVDVAAAAAGLAPGLPLAGARAVVPDLATAPLDPAADRAALTRLAEWCGRYTPWTAPDPAAAQGAFGSGAGIWLDVTGCAHLFGGEAALLENLVTRLERLGYEARAGLAETPGAAWAVARFAAGPTGARVLPAGAVRAALAELPVAALRLPPAAVESLDRLGLRRIGALYEVPRRTLTRRLGDAVAMRLDQALGAAAEPVSPLVPVPAYLERRALAEPIGPAGDVPAMLAAVLGRLLAALARRLEADHLGARRVELACYRVDGGVARLAVGTARPVRDPAHLARLFAERLERVDPGFGIEVVTVAATATEPLTALQLALGLDGRGAATAAPDSPDVAVLIDRLSNRLGRWAVARQAPRESHLPERAVRAVAALAPQRPWPAPLLARPRPARLLPRPEPVEAMALLPDHPPRLFRWRRVLHRVARAEGPERLEPEWWRPGAAAAPRDYFRVEDEGGRRFWLFREMHPDRHRWYLHGLFG